MDHSLKYVADEDYLKTQSFKVHPINDVEEIETVLKGVAEHGKETNTRIFFFRALPDTLPPNTFLI